MNAAKRSQDKSPASPVSFLSDKATPGALDQDAWMSRLIEQIISAIETDPRARHQIANESGVSEAVLSRLVNRNRTITVETLERLCDHLGLEVSISPKKRKRAAK